MQEFNPYIKPFSLLSLMLLSGLAHLLDELPNDAVKVENWPVVVGVQVGQLCEYKQCPRHSERRVLRTGQNGTYRIIICLKQTN